MPLSRVFRLLSSLKFTVALLALLIVLSAISTFSAQPEAFFGTLGFFALAFLFFVNLCCCTLRRFTRELKKTSGRNFGPDVLHGGLILFMIAALISVYNRMEGHVMIQEGETVQMPDGSMLTLEECEYQQYENGRPKDWISYLTVTRDGETLLSRAPLRVNHPVTLNGYTLYQVSYADMNGRVFSVIQAVREPFFALVFAAFIVCGAGAFWTGCGALKKILKKDTRND
jgi:cytochrome c biogenesis protein ResB